MKQLIFSFLRNKWSLFAKPRVSFCQRCFAPSLVEINQMVLDVILNFLLLSPLGKGRGPLKNLKKPKALHPTCLIEVGSVVLEKKILKFCRCIFAITLISSLGKGPFIWINLNPLRPRMLCAMFGWNWPSGSGEEDFKFQISCLNYVRVTAKGYCMFQVN